MLRRLHPLKINSRITGGRGWGGGVDDAASLDLLLQTALRGGFPLVDVGGDGGCGSGGASTSSHTLSSSTPQSSSSTIRCGWVGDSCGVRVRGLAPTPPMAAATTKAPGSGSSSREDVFMTDGWRLAMRRLYRTILKLHHGCFCELEIAALYRFEETNNHLLQNENGNEQPQHLQVQQETQTQSPSASSPQFSLQCCALRPRWPLEAADEAAAMQMELGDRFVRTEFGRARVLGERHARSFYASWVDYVRQLEAMRLQRLAHMQVVAAEAAAAPSTTTTASLHAGKYNASNSSSTGGDAVPIATVGSDMPEYPSNGLVSQSSKGVGAGVVPLAKRLQMKADGDLARALAAMNDNHNNDAASTNENAEYSMQYFPLVMMKGRAAAAAQQQKQRQPPQRAPTPQSSSSSSSAAFFGRRLTAEEEARLSGEQRERLLDLRRQVVDMRQQPSGGGVGDMASSTGPTEF